MRNRQPAGPALTGQEVALTNTALNTLLGGTQKPWMVGYSSAVKPTPRTQVNQRLGKGVLPSPSPSNEPSPSTLESPDNNMANSGHRRQVSRDSVSHEAVSQPSPMLSVQGQSNFTQDRENASSDLSLPNPPTTTQQAQLNQRSHPMQTPLSVPSLRVHIPLIEAYVREHGGWQSLNPTIERPRLSLLRDACIQEDYFFIMLHQLFCIWTLEPSTITNIDGFRDIGMTSAAFQQVSRLIRNNDGMLPVHLKWCSEFPGPLHHLLARSNIYQYILTVVCSFLSRLAADNCGMTVWCQARGYPALVDEMVNCLGLVSPILQKTFFTVSRRSLGVGDDDIGIQMELLFVQDREQHKALAARYNTASPPSEREITERNLRLKEQYLLLRNRQHQRRQSQTPVIQQAVSINAGNSTSPMTSSQNFHHSPTIPQPGGSINATPQSPGLVGVFQNLSHGSPLGRPSVPLTTSRSPILRSHDFSNVQNTVGSVLPAPSVPPLHTVSSATSQQHSQSSSPQNFHSTTPLSVAPLDSYATLNGQRSDQVHSSQISTITNPYPTNAESPQVQTSSQNQCNRNAPYQNMPTVRLNTHNLTSMNYQSPSSEPLNIAGQVETNRPVPLPPLTWGSRQTDRFSNPGPPDMTRVGLFIPQYGQALELHRPKPDETALHQVYLRSPYLVSTDPPSKSNPDDPSQRYYQAVRDFAVGPKILLREFSVSVFEFSVPDILYSRLTKERWLSGDTAASREVRQGSLQYRMRCILVKPGEIEKPNDLAVADTSWPASIFMDVNGVAVEVRRKIHHGKDLPVDITHIVKPASVLSKNKVRVSVPRLRKSQPTPEYAFSVEIIEVLQYRQIVDKCMRRPRIPAQKTLDSIKASLSGSLVDDDDEITMVAGDLTMNLADPFLSRIFKVPVRGNSCLHRECFDLETFLNTRLSKPKYPKQPSMIDVWKCPLCGKDARPYSLQVDEFLVSVRKSLAERNLLDTKAIVISADGTWKPKPEALSRKRSATQAGLDNHDASDSDEEDNHQRPAAQTDKAKEVEIIELDDD